MADNVKVERLIKGCKELMPAGFLVNVGDARIAAFIDLVIGDANLFPPLTNYTIDNLPLRMEPIVKFGTQIFSMLFLQQTYALQDFGWSDGGLSLTLDRVQKIDVPYKNSIEMYKNMVLNAKKYEIVSMGGKGLGTPRYQSQIGGFLKICLGSAFTWNQP